jgi:hypothetical protein
MSLWCDKYRPKAFDELDYQLEQAALLQTIVRLYIMNMFLLII